MKKLFNSLLRLRYLLILIIVVTILWFVINPDDLLVKGKYFNEESDMIFSAVEAAKVENNPYFNYIALANGAEYSSVYRSHSETNRLRQSDFSQSIKSKIGGTFSPLFYDVDKNKYCFISYENDNEYCFNTIENNDYMSMNSIQFYEYEMFNEVKKEEILIKDIIFYPYRVVNQEDSLLINPYKNGYRITFSNEYSNRIHKTNKDRNNAELIRISEFIAKRLNIDFTLDDFLFLHKSGKRFKYFEKRFKNENKEWKTGFLFCEILGKIDCNNDGIKDYLLSFRGHRFIYSKLMVIDGTTKKLIWEKNFIPDIEYEKILITDVDKDGTEEIFLSFYSACIEDPIDHDDSQIIGDTCISSFMILDTNGELKEINGKPLLLQTSRGYYDYRYNYNHDTNKLLMGLKSRFDSSSKNFIIYDLNLNHADTMNIEYINIINYREEDEYFIFFDKKDNKITKMIFDKDFNLVKAKSISIKNGTGKLYDNLLNIEGKQYYFTANNNQNILIEKNLDRVHYLNNYKTSGNPFQIGEDIFCIANRNLTKLTLTRNKTLNPYIIILFLVEFLLLLFYFLIKQYINIPLKSTTSNYFIVYNYFGKLYYWKLVGKLQNIYKLPKKISADAEIPNKILNDISDESELIYQKNLFIFKYKVYELQSRDESEIIQRISHDLKNQVLMMKLLTDQYSDRLSTQNKTFIEQVSSSLKNISSAAQTLSNFSHIDKLYKEEVEFNSIIEQFLMNHINHNLFENIDYKPHPEQIMIKLDENLFRIAFDNLIKNALDEIEEKEVINVIVDQKDNKLILQISNPYHDDDRVSTEFGKVGFSTKPEGSGIGLPISKVIIEKHNGDLDYFIKDKMFIVEISLP